MSIKKQRLALVAIAVGFAVAASGCGFFKDKAKTASDKLTGKGGGGGEGGDDGDVDTGYRSNFDLTAFNLTLNTYESCDALQKDVYDQLVFRVENDKAQQAYWEKERQKWQAENGGEKGAVADDAAVGAANGGADGATSDSDMASESAKEESITNVQEKGVDEADFVKLGTNHLYVARGALIEVLDRASLKSVGVMDFGKLKKLTLYAEAERLIAIGVLEEPKQACHEVEQHTYDYAYDDQGMMKEGSDQPKTTIKEECFDYALTKTIVTTYSAEKGKMPVKVSEKKFDEVFSDSRFVAGQAVLMFSSSLPFVTEDKAVESCGKNQSCFYAFYASLGGVNNWSYYSSFVPYFDYNYSYGYYGYGYGYGNTEYKPVTIPANPIQLDAEGKVRGIACDKISKPYIVDHDFRMTKIVTVDTRNQEAPVKAAATIGGGDQVYMTTTGLYLAKQGVAWQPWVEPKEGPEQEEFNKKQQNLYETLVITKVAFASETGDLGAVAVGAVMGRVKDQWAFKEYADQDVLAVATTTWGPVKPETTEQVSFNHLWILKQEEKSLALKAAQNDFGPREDIRAARYIGSMAYIVTFEKTDPLFAFDLSDPMQPKLMSELKIPGFSMYLHPTAEGRLIGVGYEGDDQGEFSWFQGIQVSLFDISNPLALSRLDVKVVGHRGSYSDVTGDHKAFFENKEKNLIGVPVVEKTKEEGGGQGWEQADKVTFSGAILYNLAGDKLEERARLTHADLIPAECTTGDDWHWWQEARRSLDINRLYTIDGRLLTVSRFGVKAHDLDNPEQETARTVFKAGKADCATRENYWEG